MKLFNPSGPRTPLNLSEGSAGRGLLEKMLKSIFVEDLTLEDTTEETGGVQTRNDFYAYQWYAELDEVTCASQNEHFPPDPPLEYWCPNVLVKNGDNLFRLLS